MGKFVDLSGNKYGLLTVIKRVGTRNGKAEWLCRCDCGNLHTTISHIEGYSDDKIHEYDARVELIALCKVHDMIEKKK